jgi:hypothetical protein
MYKMETIITIAAVLVCLDGMAQVRPTNELSAKTPVVAVTATILNIKGNFVTIVNARGQKQTLEVTSSKGLVPGARVSWCEEDCRLLRSAENSIPVLRVLTATP